MVQGCPFFGTFHKIRTRRQRDSALVCAAAPQKYQIPNILVTQVKRNSHRARESDGVCSCCTWRGELTLPGARCWGRVARGTGTAVRCEHVLLCGDLGLRIPVTEQRAGNEPPRDRNSSCACAVCGLGRPISTLVFRAVICESCARQCLAGELFMYKIVYHSRTRAHRTPDQQPRRRSTMCSVDSSDPRSAAPQTQHNVQRRLIVPPISSPADAAQCAPSH